MNTKEEIKNKIIKIRIEYETALLDCGLNVDNVDYDKLSEVRNDYDKLLSDYIDRVQIELLEEVKKELEKYKGNDTNDFIGGKNYVVENFGEDLDSKILSIKKELK